MDRLIYTAMTGASQTLSRQAAVTNNLANVSTDGYRAAEHRLRAVQVQAQGFAKQTALPTRAFAVDATTHTDFSQGPMISTARTLDMAVKGPGWIALAMPDGTEAYTRAGSMQLSVNGILQNAAGIPVQGDGGTITIPPENKITIGEDGTISVVPESGSQAIVNAVGRVKLVNPSLADLKRGDDGYFRLADGAAAPVSENTRIATGFIEGSNVNPAEQMVSMISLARQFEMQIKMLQTADANDRAGTQILSPR
jgi:flagellar basal-body rod protein FlgF